MTYEQSQLAFHLFIIEGTLTEYNLSIHRRNPKVNALFTNFTLDEINAEALKCAEHANEQVGYQIF